MIAEIGLVVITLAWVLQSILMTKKKEIRIEFVGLYMFGVALLVVNYLFTSTWGWFSWLELLTFAAAALVLVKLRK